MTRRRHNSRGGALLPFSDDWARDSLFEEQKARETPSVVPYMLRRCEGCGVPLARAVHSNATCCAACGNKDTISGLRRKLVAAYVDHWWVAKSQKRIKDEALAAGVVTAFASFEASYDTLRRVVEIAAAMTGNPQLRNLAATLADELAEHTQLLKLGARAVELTIQESTRLGAIRGTRQTPDIAALAPLFGQSGVKVGRDRTPPKRRAGIGTDADLVREFLAACDDGRVDEAIEIARTNARPGRNTTNTDLEQDPEPSDDDDSEMWCQRIAVPA